MQQDVSLDQDASGTAMATCLLRALAASDPRPDIRGDDYLAEVFLDEQRLRPIQDPKVGAWVLQNKTAPGAYEFMIARTAFFDELVLDALAQDIGQLVFLGAGYDTRPYRFAASIRNTTIFELDAAPTQVRKLACLQAAGVAIPAEVVFLPVNFESADLAAQLDRAGFRSDRLTLFVWEGVSYYLSAHAVDRMLTFVSSHSLCGSSIAFDYAALSRQNLEESSASQLHDHLQSRHSGEPVGFGIPDGSLAEFMCVRGFDVVTHLSAPDMRARYLGGSRYPELASPPLLLHLVHARVAPGSLP